MFNGLIREFAEVESFSDATLQIKASYRPRIGDSVAVNGACLTVTKVYGEGFEVELSHESQKKLAVENYRSFVHIEPALKYGDPIDGHLMQGHVDTTGKISEIIDDQKGIDFMIHVDKSYIPLIPPKGSIAIDGVSLTVNEVFEESFRLTVIPHTYENTLFKHYRVGTRVNIETDMFARYLFHMFSKEKKPSWEEVEKVMALW